MSFNPHTSLHHGVQVQWLFLFALLVFLLNKVFLILEVGDKVYNCFWCSLALEWCSAGLWVPAEPQVDGLSPGIILTCLVGYGNWHALGQHNYRLFSLWWAVLVLLLYTWGNGIPRCWLLAWFLLQNYTAADRCEALAVSYFVPEQEQHLTRRTILDSFSAFFSLPLSTQSSPCYVGAGKHALKHAPHCQRGAGKYERAQPHAGQNYHVSWGAWAAHRRLCEL